LTGGFLHNAAQGSQFQSPSTRHTQKKHETTDKSSLFHAVVIHISSESSLRVLRPG
jgi:hypothetical protein